MNTSQINTIIGGPAFLLTIHITATCVLCYLLGSLLTAALLADRD